MTIKRPLVMTQLEIGKLIRSLRLETGLTQEKFAPQLGVTFPTVNRWENNRAKPSPLAVEKIEKMVRRLGDRGNNGWQSIFWNYR
jgi:putative transcriptional regulator